jgi:hypothetical protein
MSAAAKAGVERSMRRFEIHGQDELFDLVGKGTFAIEAVGESYHQSALRQIVGKREGYVALSRRAELFCEDDNPYDSNAVAVRIAGKKVGHLDRELASRYRETIRDMGFGKATGRCKAMIYGGGPGKPLYGIWLDI